MQVLGPKCGGCPLEHRGTIWIPSSGSGQNGVLLYGDSGWKHEATTLRDIGGTRVGTPFAGPSGWWVDRNLSRISARREDFLVANSLWCRAERLGYTDHPEKYPEVAQALQHCSPYTDELIERMGVKAIVTMGGAALHRITGHRDVEKNHGYYLPTRYGIPAIPTFHPSFILRGNQKLSAAWCFSVKRAMNIALGRVKLAEYDLLLDPTLNVARSYLESGNEVLVCDIETAEVHDENEDEREESSWEITRISFSNRRGSGISFPWRPPYVHLAREVLNNSKEVVFWNQGFDAPRLRREGVTFAKVTDAMFAWHFLQSDLPKALGFVAPFYTCIEPWKHLSSFNPAFYSAMDAAVTMDCYLGIKADLEREQRWAAFERHCTNVWPILESMSAAGVKLDTEHQQAFKSKLEAERDAIGKEMQSRVPDEVKTVKVYKKKPSVVLPFNPGSSQQVIKLIKHLGLKVPIAKGEDRETTEAKHLKALSKKNSTFKLILDYRERSKLIDAYIWPVSTDGRIHTQFSFHPSTWRKSSRNPNVQTIPKRNDLAKEFRRMVCAGAGNTLIECDSSAIEAVLVGFFGGSQRYIDLAKQGVHKWLASEFAGRKVSKDEPLYDQIKRVVHLSNYMGTPQRIADEYPDTFASVKDARKLQEFYFNTEPGKDVRRWQQQVMQQAHRERHLQNPWGYRHYFYDVLAKRDGEWKYGDDAKRAIAFLPQSTASAIQTEFLLELAQDKFMLDSLRLIVHDSIILEVPNERAIESARKLLGVMTRPFAELCGLSIGAECKIGPNLAEMGVFNG